LIDRLEAELARKVTLISAPAGFGKTTLISEWLARQMRSIAWVALDAGDNDPVRFWRYVITACSTFDAALGRSALAALRLSPVSSLEGVLTPFINELAQLSDRFVLILEDYHTITANEVHASLAFLIDHLPATLHVIIMTRSEPSLPLARLRARNELTEFTSADLRFSLEEIQTFLQQTLHVSPTVEVLKKLEEQTEGWPAGLRLITLARHDRSGTRQAEEFLATFSGGHRYVLEYLVGEVIATQSEKVQEFLLQTSVLNRLTGSLCDAVTGRSDSSLLLDQLEHANLFVLRLGNEGPPIWYRYHPLFAEALRHMARQRLAETVLHALHDKAAHWHAAHSSLIEAIEAALAAQTFDHAAMLIERLLERRDMQELHTLRRWFAQLPPTVMDEHPQLRFNEASAILFSLDRFAPATGVLVEAALQPAEAAWRAAQNERGLGQVLALRALSLLWQGDTVRSSTAAREALELLPEDETYWRGVSLLTATTQDWNAGQLEAVQRAMLEAYALCEASQNVFGALAARLILAQVYQAQLELDQAAEIYRQVLARAEQSDAMRDDQAAARLGLGAIAYERNDLIMAETSATQALRLSEQRLDEEMQVQASLLLARVQQARGDTGPTQATLNALAARTHRPGLLREIRLWKARFALAENDGEAAQRWHADLPHMDDVPYLQQEREALINARLHLAAGQPAEALQVLERWQRTAHTQGRARSEIELLCVQALAHAAHGEAERAQKTLARALTLAQPTGGQRVFLDEGAPLADLLQKITPDLGKRPVATFATILLRAFAATRSGQLTSFALSPLLEPLSAQEQRVLRLLAAGLSNQRSRAGGGLTNTIKTQVQSIYRGSTSLRDEAADIARQLNLL
jgi:LuxR family maltose regulon positive regulatory protein